MAAEDRDRWMARRAGKAVSIEPTSVHAITELRVWTVMQGTSSRLDAEMFFDYSNNSRIRLRVEGVRALELPGCGYGTMPITELFYDSRADPGWEQGRHHLWDECGGFSLEFDRFVETVIE